MGGDVNKNGRTPEERFWSRVLKTRGCWRWTGYHMPNGYGTITVKRKVWLVHRFVWTLVVGPIPEGMTIDHVKTRECVWRDCVRPDHLEIVTLAENNRRSDGVGGRWRQTHCKRGHEFTSENTERRPNGTRRCIACELWRRKCRWQRILAARH